MRMIYLALVVFLLVLVLGIAGAAQSGGPAPLHLAANATVLALPSTYHAAPKIMSVLSEAAPPTFCGQCTSDSDCGTDHKCCGPSNCLECFRVDTCP